MVVFQPAEETAEGAQAMIDDGLFQRFPKPGGSSRARTEASAVATLFEYAVATQDLDE